MTTYTSGVASRIERTTYDYKASGIRVSALHEVDTDADGNWDTRTLTDYSQVLRETEIDADTDEVLKVVEYTIVHDQISRPTVPYSVGTPAIAERYSWPPADRYCSGNQKLTLSACRIPGHRWNRAEVCVIGGGMA